MQPRSFIQVTPSFSRKGRLRDTAFRTAVSLTGAGSSAQTMALRVPKQNRVTKITRVMLDLTRLTVALPSLENRRPSCVPRLSTIKRFRRQSTAIQRGGESTSATCLSSGSLVRDSDGDGVHPLCIIGKL